MADRHFWLRCGNCGELFINEYATPLAWAFANHMRILHGDTIWHVPTGNVCLENR
jgi:hypothetical protein